MLPLDAALRYTARLRLPSDTSRTEIESCVSAMLDSVRLSQHRATRIRQLSGGQRKRASWVNEAICNPSLIFLDEVTSGLDEQTDCEMMQLFRKMADDGKTSFASRIESGTSNRPAIWPRFWAPAECSRSSVRRPRR